MMKALRPYLLSCLAIASCLALGGCLKAGLPKAGNSSLDAMTSFNYEYRWLDTTYILPGTPQADTSVTVNVVQLGNTVVISNDTVYTSPSYPSNLPASQVPNVTLTHIWGYANIPDAAVIYSVDEAPKLGDPGDYSKPATYKIVAADGSTATWVVVTAPLH
ncbi:MAG TPA: hypothetical protein VL547_07795 [Dinghuibacter sp.]|uniref:DUF5018-related domain-containing protein n=1 Tax=Dinghuibacter sp. TaxID=2024697 RepID=UPI002CCBB166|nr:hypothetical protein [Dinghuibacter sp.]HTJ11911.1 hypothetical protein [Dinghuibacter sp.]